MNTKLTIKNFRVFDENGVTVDLKPITVLTGCNSSGKSSVVKAALMLNCFVQQGNKVQITFRSLGAFDGVLHKGSKSNKIIIEYSIYSLLLSEDVTVKVVFTKKENDKLNNVILESFEIRNEECSIYTYKNTACLQGDENTKRIRRFFMSTCYSINLIPFKEKSCEFLRLADLYISWRRIKQQQQVESLYFWDNMTDIEKEKYEDLWKLIDEGKEWDYIISTSNVPSQKRFDDIIDYCNNNEGVMAEYWKKITRDFVLIDKIQETGYLFYIPILDTLTKMNKDDFRFFLSKTFSEDSLGLNDFVCDKFAESNENTFGDFFKNMENAYLSAYSRNSGGMIKVDDFNSWLRFLMYLNDKVTDGRECEYYNKFEEDCPPRYPIFEARSKYGFSHKMEPMLDIFFDDFKVECLKPLWCGGMSYVSSARANIKRLYSFDFNDEFTNSLKNYLSIGNDEKQFIDKWINKFGIGHSISFDVVAEGLGAQIRLHKTPDDEQGRLLADEGYGITQLVSVLLQIELQKGFKNLTIAVEEPEIHLHPKFQSLLADMFVDAYQTYGIHFIIETHSEYLIRRLQLLVAGIETEKKLDKNEVSIAYIYTKDEAEKENQPLVKNISICEDGYLDDTFGSGFFDEATKLSRKLM